MRKIEGKAKTVRELLKGVKYSIDYYQREFKWNEKQVTELVDDLVEKFSDEYKENHDRKKVAEYPHYFLGSIIISKKDDVNFIIDGQQRLTCLSLFAILLYRLQLDRDDAVQIKELIFSEQYGDKSFNLNVKERASCMDALLKGDSYNVSDAAESVRNLYNRYQDIEDAFEIQDKALPYFVDWMLENVHLVEITAYSDDDAYTIFETMNDRGLSLSPTDMLKGFLLANIDKDKRDDVNSRWKVRIGELTEWGKESGGDCFKAWFRSQYATKIRERKKDAKKEDFDRIGTEFHRWVRDAKKQIDLNQPSDFLEFINYDFDFYSKQYLRIREAANEMTRGLEHVYYNDWYLFPSTQQYMLLLAPLRPDDTSEIIDKKIRITARYIDILLTWRLWNSQRIASSTMQYPMFKVMLDIRRCDVGKLANILYGKLQDEEVNFDEDSDGYLQWPLLNQKNRKNLRIILARMTDFVEVNSSGVDSRFDEYVKYEIEHIWANHYDRHTDEFEHPGGFSEYRNYIGGLLLLPKSDNASYGDMPYSDKLDHYFSQNLLAKSLHQKCYEHNPGFTRFIDENGLQFKAIAEFKKSDIDERFELYRQIAKRVWNPGGLLKEVSG